MPRKVDSLGEGIRESLSQFRSKGGEGDAINDPRKKRFVVVIIPTVLFVVLLPVLFRKKTHSFTCTKNVIFIFLPFHPIR